jgi:hypothetical protein
MGRIIKFPIHVETTRASEAGFGILNPLMSYVRPVSSAATDYTVSEKGLWTSLSAIFVQTSGVNKGVGFPIFISGDIGAGVYGNTNDLYFNTLDSSFDGFEVVKNQTDDVPGLIYVKTDQSDPEFFIEMKQFNGGVLQESTNIDSTDFTDYDSVVLFKSPDARTAIGKIVMRCNNPFGFDGTSISGYIGYTIGTDDNPDGLVADIDLARMDANTLVEFNYGNLMMDKVQYVGYEDNSGVFNTFNLLGGQDIKMFISGGVSSPRHNFGNMDCVIFYDAPEKLAPSTARTNIYVPGGQRSNITSDWNSFSSPSYALAAVQRFDESISMCSVEHDLEMTEAGCRYGLVSRGGSMWYYGGNTDDYKNSVFRIDSETRTVTNVDTVGTLADNAKSEGVSTRDNGYFFGGGDGTIAAVVQALKMSFSTETAAAVATPSISGYDLAAMTPWNKDYNYHRAYLAGGRTDETNMCSLTLKYFDFTTDTMAGQTQSILTSKYSMCGESDGVNGYYFGGHFNSSSSASAVFRMNHVTETMAVELDAALMFRLGEAAISSSPDHSEFYILGGRDNSGVVPNAHVVQFNPVNHTSQIINSMVIPVCAAKAGRI